MSSTKESRFNYSLILNWIFIPGLLLLAINDHYLKWQYHNSFTGKLSDFTGLLIFPLFLQYIFSRSRHSSLVTGVLFLFWKSSFSEGFINWYNEIAFIPIQRTIDYTDLMALSILPFADLVIRQVQIVRIKLPATFSVNPLLLLVPCSFVFMATSPPVSYGYNRPGGDVHIGKEYKLKISRSKILERIKGEGFEVKKDTVPDSLYQRESNYYIENVVLGKDTIPKIGFAIYGDTSKSILLITHVTINGDIKFTDWRKLKQVSRLYRKAIKENLIEEIK